VTADERAIRDIVATWIEATRKGDAVTVLSLMADDVVFTTPGREPFGKKESAASFAAQKEMKLDGSGDVREVKVEGDWAFARTFLKVSSTPPGSDTVRREGWTLAIFQKGDDRKWRLARDANMLTVVK
jgi:uncharacterized protein (TIGR02246 family)